MASYTKLFLCLTLLVSSCSNTNAVLPQDNKFVDLIASTKPAIVNIRYSADEGKSWGDRGTGAFITKTEILTAKHVVEVPTLIYCAVTQNGKTYPIKFSKLHEKEDVAIVTVDTTGAKEEDIPKPLALAPTNAKEGEDIFTIGYPMNYGLLSSTGIVSKLTLGMKEGELPELGITAVIAPGSSGSPILDSKGKIVGVVTSIGRYNGTILPGFTLGVPVSSIQKFITK